jgi:hypothetical protein
MKNWVAILLRRAGAPQSFQKNPDVIPENSPGPPPSIFFEIYYSSQLYLSYAVPLNQLRRSRRRTIKRTVRKKERTKTDERRKMGKKRNIRKTKIIIRNVGTTILRQLPR